ncbi:MAG: YdcF family protein [Acidobacteriota bacterium]
MHHILWLKKLILPPSGCLLVGLAGVIVAAATPWHLGGLAIATTGLGLLYLLSLPALVDRWLRRVDRFPRCAASRAETGDERPQAIVILDGGRADAPSEHGGPAVTPRTLERLDEGVRLHRVTGLPVLVTGYGDLLAATLESSFSLRPHWIEKRSRNTHENALYSAELLRRDGVERIYLVTHFWHLRRSLMAFRHAGLAPTPVPAGRARRVPSYPGLLNLVPDEQRLSTSYLLSHEWIGRLWYRLRYGYDGEGRSHV